MDVARATSEAFDSEIPRRRHPFVVLADRQSAGRGRVAGRVWTDSGEASLLMTLSVPSEMVASALPPLAVGLGLHEALSGWLRQVSDRNSDSLSLRIKWPNDLVWIPRGAGALPCLKLAGILCEKTGSWLYAGVGLNLLPEAYRDAPTQSATSLFECSMPECQADSIPALCMDREKLAGHVASLVMKRLSEATATDEFMSRMWGIGSRVQFASGHPDSGSIVSGVIRGIDESGRILILRDSGELAAYASGEISSIKSQPVA